MGGPILDHDPRSRIVFLYNPLRTHLLQILKDQGRRKDVHRHVRSQPMELVPTLAEAVAGGLTDAQCAAAMWLLGAHLCARLLARPDAGRVLVMNGQDLIADPRPAVRAVAGHFGLADHMVRAGLAALEPAVSHAKYRGVAYDKARLADDLAAAERRCGEDVEAGMAWAHGQCPELVGVFRGTEPGRDGTPT
jgi:hypothetical protein